MAFISEMMNKIFTPHCVLCDKLRKSLEKSLCEECSDLLIINSGERKLPNLRLVYLHPYKNPWKKCISKWKNSPHSGEFKFAEIVLSEFIHTHQSYFKGFDGVIPVPSKTFFSLGFSSLADTIAQRFSQECGLRVKDILGQNYFSTPQKILNAEKRKMNAQNKFYLKNKNSLKGKYLLVDDISSTGSTLTVCCEILTHCFPNICVEGFVLLNNG